MPKYGFSIDVVIEADDPESALYYVRHAIKKLNNEPNVKDAALCDGPDELVD